MKNLLSNYQHQKLFSKIFVLIWIIVLCFGGSNSFLIQTMLGLTTCFLFLSYIVYKKTDLLIAISFAYFSISHIPQMMDPARFFPTYDARGIITFQDLLSQGLLYFLAVSLFAIYSKNKFNFKNIFLTFAIIDSLALLANFAKGLPPYFIFNNPAVDASFIACCIPLTFSKYKSHILMFCLLTAACFITLTSSSILGISAAIFFYSASYYKFNFKKIGLYSLYGIFLSALGYLLQGNVVWNSSGRLFVWKIATKYWLSEINPLTGAGTGTFAVYGPTLQMLYAIKHNIDTISGFFWAHNDYLQILFENGVIGIILALLVLGRALWRLRYKPMYFGSLMTFSCLAFIQMPLRHILFTIFGAWLVMESISTQKPAGKI